MARCLAPMHCGEAAAPLDAEDTPKSRKLSVQMLLVRMLLVRMLLVDVGDVSRRMSAAAGCGRRF
jgi:hypothetical protein